MKTTTRNQLEVIQSEMKKAGIFRRVDAIEYQDEADFVVESKSINEIDRLLEVSTAVERFGLNLSVR